MLNNVFKLVCDGVSKKLNPDGNGAIIYFHRVLSDSSLYYPDDITESEFESLIKLFSRVFNLSSLNDIDKPSKDGRMRLAITFDDGYKDNLKAAKILKKYGAPCTFFVSTEGVEKGILWQDKIIECIKAMTADEINQQGGSTQGKAYSRAAFAHEKQTEIKQLSPYQRNLKIKNLEDISGKDTYPRIMLDEDDIKTLSKDPLFDIGGHTHSHSILSTLSSTQTRDEIRKNKVLLEVLVGREIKHFAYPNGNPRVDYSEKDINTVSVIGYKKAFTTGDGGVKKSSHKLELPRFMPYRKNKYLRALSIIKIAGE